MPRPARADPAGAPGTDPAGVTVGVLGGSWRGRVTPWGAVVPADGSATLDWWIAAEDRWHTPAIEPSVRQRAVEGVPVVETAVRVPGGDVVQTVYAVADGGGFTVIELENRSPAGVAVALSRRDLVTSRPPATVPVEGVDAPADALVVPIGHHASARVALAHDGGVGGVRGRRTSRRRVRSCGAGSRRPGRGWTSGSPTSRPAVGLTALRCALLLEGPPPPDAGAAHLVAVAELGRLGSAVEPWLDDAVVVAEAIGRRARRSPRLGWDDDAGLVAAREVLERAGHGRGAADVVALRRRLPAAEPTPLDPPEGMLGLAWAERRIVVADADGRDARPAPGALPPVVGRSAGRGLRRPGRRRSVRDRRCGGALARRATGRALGGGRSGRGAHELRAGPGVVGRRRAGRGAPQGSASATVTMPNGASGSTPANGATTRPRRSTTSPWRPAIVNVVAVGRGL